MNWKTDAVMNAATPEDAIAEIAAHYFRKNEATDGEAAYLVDHIYSALGLVEQEQEKPDAK